MDKTKVFIFGISGKMGKEICAVAQQNNCEVTGGFDVVKSDLYPTFSDIEKINVPFDVVIDFSRPETLDSVISLSEKCRVPAVLATTGYSDSQLAQIEKLSARIPVFRAVNMSVGVNVVSRLIKQAVQMLGGDYDIEIIEKHHNQKVDAPSGTAKMLADSAADAMRENGDNASIVYGREGVSLRKKGEITVHAVRGGTIVGEHEVLFCGTDEIVSVSHVALSRKVLAVGALRAAKFVADKTPGMYGMDDLLS